MLLKVLLQKLEILGTGRTEEAAQVLELKGHTLRGIIIVAASCLEEVTVSPTVAKRTTNLEIVNFFLYKI